MPIYSNPKTYLSAGGGDPRDTAIRIEQTVDLAGKVLAVKYFMANGDTVEDSLTYGANSTLEPTVFTRGTLIAAPLPVMLTTFNLSSNGTTFNYTVVGGSVTALGGKLMVGATNYPLTHVSSGVATIASSIKLGDVVTFSVTSSSPSLSTPVTNAAVVNSSTQVTPTLSLSSWSVATNGTTVNYTATGGTVTALTGNLTVAGVSRVLTHVSSGVASIPVTAYTGDVVTVTLTASTPVLSTGVSAVGVTNNSSVAAPPPSSTLSNFIVATNGTSVSYSNSGSPVTAITGFLSVGATSYTLTHVSNLSATITPAILTGVTVTATVSAAVPALTAALSAVAVTNNSTATPGLNPVAFTWTLANGATLEAPNIRVTGAQTPHSGATSVQAIDTTKAFEILFEEKDALAGGFGTYLAISQTATASTVWTDNSHVVVVTNYANNLYTRLPSSGGVSEGAVVNFYKLVRAANGADLELRTSTNGLSYALQKTFTGMLTGKPTLYVKGGATVASAQGGSRLFLITANVQV